MDWPTAILCGAIGGCVIEAIVFYGRVSMWQAARRRAAEKRRKRLPPLRDYIDVPADSLVALTRLVLGATAGWLFHTQIIGVYAAVAVGASAPALLRQLGTVRQVQDVVHGPLAVDAGPATGMAVAGPATAEAQPE
ncbi:hypothetical protein OK074_2175 [Actinobacteria bacterium OK074]|nr:hypothetical protein OK074_2175 [Actinobacteria bacterium OK074]